MSTEKRAPGFLKAQEEREERGLTYAQFGEILGMSAAMIDAGVIQGYEKGMPVNSGAVRRIYESLQRGRLQASTWLNIGRWSVSSPSDDDPSWVVHHNEWPRFVAKALREELHKEQWRFARSGMPVFEMSQATGCKQLVFSFIDHVPVDFDPEDVLTEAVLQLERRILNDMSVADSQNQKG